MRNTVRNKIKAFDKQKSNTMSQAGHGASGAASDIFGLGTFTLTGTSGTGGEDDFAQAEADKVSMVPTDKVNGSTGGFEVDEGTEELGEHGGSIEESGPVSAAESGGVLLKSILSGTPASKGAPKAAKGTGGGFAYEEGVGYAAESDSEEEEGEEGQAGLPPPDLVSQVSGWGAYCQASVGFLLLPVAPGVSCLSVDALHTRSSKLPLSPNVSQCLPMSPNVYNPSKFTPQPPSKVIDSTSRCRP